MTETHCVKLNWTWTAFCLKVLLFLTDCWIWAIILKSLLNANKLGHKWVFPSYWLTVSVSKHRNFGARTVCTHQGLWNTQWLLSLLPCQGTVNQAHTCCSDTVLWEPHKGAAQWPFTTASDELQLSCPWGSQLTSCLSRTATAKTTLPVPARQQQLTEKIPESALSNLLHTGTDTTPLTASAGKADLPRQKEEGMSSAAPALPSSSLVPLHIFRRLDGPNWFRRNPTL